MKRPPGDPLGGNGYDVEVPPPHIAEAFGLADKELALHRRFVLVEVAEIAYPAVHTRITHTVILDRPDLYHREARQSR